MEKCLKCDGMKPHQQGTCLLHMLFFFPLEGESQAGTDKEHKPFLLILVVYGELRTERHVLKVGLQS